MVEKKLSNIVRELVTLTKKDVEQISRLDWNSEKRSLGKIVLRAILIRQHEIVDALDALSTINYVHIAAYSVRVSFEELIWVIYLKKMDEKKRNFLLKMLIQKEIFARSIAQRDNMGSFGQMMKLGFPASFVKNLNKNSKEVNKALSELKIELGWRSRDLTPSMSELAESADLLELYNFLYEGSSRMVHFSTGELMRRCWYKSDRASISTTNFYGYWSEFSQFWLAWLFGMTTLVASEEFEFTFEMNDLSRIMNEINLHKMPIITPEELNFV